jgi:polar amino acid transport system substrate-binding protein
MMLKRLRAVGAVVFLIAVAGAPPGLTADAHAEPRAVTVATDNTEPFVITDGAVRYGFTIDLLDEIAKRTGWTYNYIDAGNVQGILQAVADGNADLGAADISITADREHRFNFTQPILAAGLQIIVPADSTERVEPGLIDFVKLLFSHTMAVWLMAALALTVLPAHIIWLFERGDPGSMVSRRYFPGILQAFGWGLGMLAAAPFDSPQRWPIRMVTVLWTFVSIIFVAYYTAILTSNLTIDQIRSQIGSPTDLIGKRVCTEVNTTAEPALDRVGVRYSALPKIEDCYSEMKNGHFDAVVSDAPLLAYYVTHRGAGFAALAGPIFKDEDYGIVFPNNSRLKEDADAALLSMQDDGSYDMLKQKWFGNPR